MSPEASTPGPTRDRKAQPTAVRAVRSGAARAVRLAFGALATILALGVLLVVLRSNVNGANPVVQLITDVADTIAGPFGLQDGVFAFSGADATSKNALANWGVAALLYLLLGRVLAGAIAPRRMR
jgi:hypothetical protein